MIRYSTFAEPVQESSSRRASAKPEVEAAACAVEIPALEPVLPPKVDAEPLTLSSEVPVKAKKPRVARTPKAKVEPTTTDDSDKADEPLMLNLDAGR